jgi:hypothetical protein
MTEWSAVAFCIATQVSQARGVATKLVRETIATIVREITKRFEVKLFLLEFPIRASHWPTSMLQNQHARFGQAS